METVCCHSRTVSVRFNKEKRLAQINVVPRYIMSDGDEKMRVLRDLEEIPPMIRRSKDAGDVSRVVVVVDGTNILAYFDEATLVMDALIKRREEEALVDRVIVTNADEETKLRFKLFAAAKPSLREACSKITFIS